LTARSAPGLPRSHCGVLSFSARRWQPCLRKKARRTIIKRFPSIQSLRAIESVDRNGALWRAAEELHVTRSAISHQLRMLERDLGFKLFERAGNGHEITPRGRAYAEDIRRALSMIANATTQVEAIGLSGQLTLSCPAGFMSAWLCLNIREFIESNPGIVLTVLNARNLSETANPLVDMFITFGLEPRSHVQCELLLPVEFTPLCSPAYMTRFRGFSDLRSLRHTTLLHIGDFADWKSWMKLVGLPAEEAQRGICYPDMSVVHTAVMAGEGIAIGDTILWRKDLEAGHLMRPFAQSLHTQTQYHLCTPEKSVQNPLVVAFRNWLITKLDLINLR
jgi:LysR family glycine cleavage system transcriptional activator